MMLKPENVMEVTLLSANEYKPVEHDVPWVGDEWWLRTPGSHNYLAAIVDSEVINADGFYVGQCKGVRPALRVNPESIDHIESSASFGGHEWTRISKDMFLCNETIRQMPFNKTEDSNDYETSDVKKWLEKWFQEAKHFQDKPFDVVVATGPQEGCATTKLINLLTMFPENTKVVPITVPQDKKRSYPNYCIPGAPRAIGFMNAAIIELYESEMYEYGLCTTDNDFVLTLKDYINKVANCQISPHEIDNTYEFGGYKIYIEF